MNYTEQQAIKLSTILQQADETTVDDLTMLSLDADDNITYIRDWEFHTVDLNECNFLISAIDEIDDMLKPNAPAELKLSILTRAFWYDVN